MKITYPDYQIDISVEEVIALMDDMRRNEPIIECGKIEVDKDNYDLLRKMAMRSTEKRESPYKTICCPECGWEFKEEVPDFMEGEFCSVCPNCGTKIMGTKVGNGISIFTLPADEQPNGERGDQDQEPEPKPKKPTRLKKPKKTRKPTDNEPPKKKSSGNCKAVQVLFENGWKTYKSVSQAAEAIGTKLNHLSHALLNNKTCNGYQVRYAVDSKEQNETTHEEPTELP